ncbi:hypothetical protein D9M70_594560 [compost metagenome]
MAIEPAMGQAGRGHHINHADAMQAALAKQPRGGLDDDFAIEVGLLAGNSGHQALTVIKFECQRAYWAMPLPNDQFSFFTSTRLMKTSSARTASCALRPSTMVL